jgi:GMP synthase (glutamine-hydrolysing)
MIEPLSDFYKDDTIKFAPKVGTPQKVTEDEPMPGPGFVVRTKCIPRDFTFDAKKIRDIDIRANDIASSYDLKVFTMPYITVGVQGDTRTEAHPAIVVGEIDEHIFKEFSKKLTDSIKEISRVWFLLSPLKINSIEILCGSYVTKNRVERLREFEYATKVEMKKHKVGRITQFPLFLIPEGINGGNEMVVLRPFYSLDYMTGESVWMSKEITNDIVNVIDKTNKKMDYKKIAVSIEGEGKPPGTTELE